MYVGKDSGSLQEILSIHKGEECSYSIFLVSTFFKILISLKCHYMLRETMRYSLGQSGVDAVFSKADLRCEEKTYLQILWPKLLKGIMARENVEGLKSIILIMQL